MLQLRHPLFLWPLVPGLLLCRLPSYSGPAAERAQTYSKVRVWLTSTADMATLIRHDITADHFTGAPGKGIDLFLSAAELHRLRDTGFKYEILIPDVRMEYESRTPPSPSELLRGEQLRILDGVSGFEFGSMGGFYTFDEVVRELDSMYLEYPQIITQKTSLGISHDGNDIWMVKISDNPTVNESGTEPAVYYDALHHAREPGSMSTTIYFMYWLLENYGTDPQATYLVDHREMFFVPVVNPDGYLYNQLTDPNGGGMWRKNRRDNGSSCYGVDLNRNYSYGYGDPNGSSDDPCSETYRGPDAFSEPETEATRDLLLAIRPAIALSVHTFAERFLNPYGYIAEAPSYEIYSGFSSDFVAGSTYLYGITSEMLGYFSSGTTRDFLHSEGTIAWTPELGSDGFWPPQSSIIPMASENLPRFRSVAWFGGAFADFQNLRILGKGYTHGSDTLTFSVGVRNRGLTQAADNVLVSVSTAYPHAEILTGEADYGSIAPGSTVHNTTSPFRFHITDSAAFLDEIPVVISVTQEGVVTANDTVGITVGRETVLFSDNAENGTSEWNASGSGTQWDTTFVGAYDGAHSFADSRYGNSANNTTNYFTLLPSVDLSTAHHPRAAFSARWSIEENYDYARFQISTDGITWQSLPGLFTRPVQNIPSYTGSRYWVREQIDLSGFVGNQVMLRFTYHADGGLPGDGFYFDEFRVVDLTDSSITAVENPAVLPLSPFLHQNHPNPFNPSTTIRFDIPAATRVTIRVYDGIGREVATLADADYEAGRWAVTWDGMSSGGQDGASGVYYCRIRAGGFVGTRKMILLR